MSASYSIPDRIELLRSRAHRYKKLAEALSDHRTASEVAAFAGELEAEVGRLEKWEESERGRDRDRAALVP
jgi:hypothetical protein